MVVNILLWALFDLIAGAVAKFIGKSPERTDPAGVILTMVLGIAGAVVGGFLSSQLFGWDINSLSVPGFAVAVGGALLLLFLYRVFMSARRSLCARLEDERRTNCNLIHPSSGSTARRLAKKT
jgi:uncharacterized membrane protein YeaQ/YmgE (transglycosylase-associated protein family)